MGRKSELNIDISGVVLPDGPASGVDRLKARYLYTQRQLIVSMIQEAMATVTKPHRRTIWETLSSFYLGLPFHNTFPVFDHPLVFYWLKKADSWKENETLSSNILAGFIPGINVVPYMQLILDGWGFPDEGLSFPHLNLKISRFNGALAIQIDGDKITFTWSDGYVFNTSSANPSPLPFASDRILKGAYISSLPLLNGWQSFPDQPFSGYIQSQVSEFETQTFNNAMNWLQFIWPLAYANVRRFYKGCLLLQSGEGFTRTLTTGELPGLFIGSVKNEIQLGDALVHEVSHLRMNYLLQLDSLLKGDKEEIHPSPWRTDLRPMIGILNGVHAFINVCNYYQKVVANSSGQQRENAAAIFDLQRTKTIEGWNYLKKHGRPNRLGKRVFKELESAITKL